MTNANKASYVYRAILFAACFELAMMLLGWLLIGPPQTMNGFPTLKLTATVGILSLSQLLDARHQFSSINFQQFGVVTAAFAVFSMVLFSLANGLFIALLGRSVHDIDGSPWGDAAAKLMPLLGWMLFQVLLGLVMMLLLSILGPFGAILGVALLLWFRYAFFFFEYTLVLGRVTFAEAWGRCREIRRHAGNAFGLFLVILALNAFLAFVVNYAFNWPMIILMLAVNAALGTVLQKRVVELYYEGQRA